MKVKVVLHPENEGGYSVAIPELPGCVSCGETMEKALANVREAAEGMIEVMNEQNPFDADDRSPQDQVMEIDL
jgi:predicted RNase H-like HicB family nuclease